MQRPTPTGDIRDLVPVILNSGSGLGFANGQFGFALTGPAGRRRSWRSSMAAICSDSWHGGRGDLGTEVTHAQVAWTGSNPVADQYQASVRLFMRTYDNPRPEVEVVSVDFVSKLTPAAPFLVAMTVEP
jgi:hypothetical protein